MEYELPDAVEYIYWEETINFISPNEEDPYVSVAVTQRPNEPDINTTVSGTSVTFSGIYSKQYTAETTYKDGQLVNWLPTFEPEVIVTFTVTATHYSGVTGTIVIPQTVLWNHDAKVAEIEDIIMSKPGASVARGDGEDKVLSNTGKKSGSKCPRPRFTKTDECSGDVFVNGIGVIRENEDKVYPHNNRNCNVDNSILNRNPSPTVYANGERIARINSQYTDSPEINTILEGSRNVFVASQVIVRAAKNNPTTNTKKTSVARNPVLKNAQGKLFSDIPFRRNI